MSDIYRHMLYKQCDVYYYDTDSIITDKPLDTSWVDNNKMGSYKLVAYIKEGYFLAPKIYGYIDSNNEFTIRFKGLKKENKLKFTIQDMRNIYNNIHLFNADNNILNYLNTKSIYTYKSLIKNIKDFTIIEKSETLQPMFHTYKYIKVYDNNNKWIDTKPYHIKISIYWMIFLWLIILYYVE